MHNMQIRFGGCYHLHTAVKPLRGIFTQISSSAISSKKRLQMLASELEAPSGVRPDWLAG